MTLPITVVQYLDMRAAPYGGTASEMLAKTPVMLWDSPQELMTFWDNRDLSHIFPQSDYPGMANDWSNIFPEDASVNRSRGAQIVTEEEYLEAAMENEAEAAAIDAVISDDSPEFLAELVELVSES